MEVSFFSFFRKSISTDLNSESLQGMLVSHKNRVKLTTFELPRLCSPFYGQELSRQSLEREENKRVVVVLGEVNLLFENQSLMCPK